jgi:glycosyltransferase involved in cell wall biosynthesis
VAEVIALSVTLPFFNEEPNVVPVLEDLVQVLDAEGVRFEILAVDNGSTDATGRLIDEMHAQDRRIVPVKIQTNRGYGNGILTGMREATGEVMGYTWGDGQVRGADLVRIYRALVASDAHLAKARRTERHDGLFRLIQTRCYALIFTLLFGPGIRDPNGCPKLFRASAYAAIAPVSRDWLLDPEIMVKAKRLGYRMENVPVVFGKRERGRSKISPFTGLGFLAGLLRMRLQLPR